VLERHLLAEIADVICVVACAVGIAPCQIQARRLAVGVVVGAAEGAEVGHLVNDGVDTLVRLTPKRATEIDGEGGISGIYVGIDVVGASRGVAIGVEGVVDQPGVDPVEHRSIVIEIGLVISSKPSDRGSIAGALRHAIERTLGLRLGTVDGGVHLGVLIGLAIGALRLGDREAYYLFQMPYDPIGPHSWECTAASTRISE